METCEQEILNQHRRLAVIGLSPDPDRPSNRVARYLMEHGYEIVPVNPHQERVLGRTCYPDLASIPEPVDVVVIFRRGEEALPLVEESIRIGCKAVWMQEGVVNARAALRAVEAGLQCVMDRCMAKEHRRARQAGRREDRPAADRTKGEGRSGNGQGEEV